MQSQSELTTLMIAWQIARVDGLNQVAAIRKCARRLRDKTKDSVLYDLFKSVLVAKDSEVVKYISALHDKLVQDGLLYAK